MLFADVTPEPWRFILATCLIVAAIFAVYKQIEVRFTLLVTALLLGWLADLDTGAGVKKVVQKFFETFANEKFVVPICTAMGFAYVLGHTGCDKHLVRLLVRPLTAVRFLLLPGTVLAGFLVNMPIVSQTSTAVTIGPVVIPILLAARFSPVTVGAAVLLGSSVGGELLNPGAPELRTTIDQSTKAARELGLPDTEYNTERCVQRLLPLNLVGLATATAVFWWLALRYEKRAERDRAADGSAARAQATPTTGETPPATPSLEVNYLKALVPLIPLSLLYLAAPPLQLIDVPRDWLVEEGAPQGLFESRLIGAAMLVGVVVAGLIVWRQSLGVVKAFFEGSGFGFGNIVSLIVIANCFGEAIKEVGLASVIGQLAGGQAALLLSAAGVLSLGFAFLCGSGMAATQSLFVFFAKPALLLGIDPTHAGAVVSIASAAGRTMSPVAAVTLMTARLTETTALDLSRRVAVPLLAGVTAMIAVAIFFRPS